MAARYQKLVCPRAGGVHPCDYVQHLSMIDDAALSGSREGRVIAFVDHLHQHFAIPGVIRDAAYMPPSR